MVPPAFLYGPVRTNVTEPRGSGKRSQLEPAHLAHAGSGQRLDQVPVTRAGGGRQIVLRPFRKVADVRRMLLVTGDDVGDGHHVADRVRPAENGAFKDAGCLGEGSLDLGQ